MNNLKTLLVVGLIFLMGCGGGGTAVTMPDPDPAPKLTQDVTKNGTWIDALRSMSGSAEWWYDYKWHDPPFYIKIDINSLLSRALPVQISKVPVNKTGVPAFPDFTTNELAQWIAHEVTYLTKKQGTYPHLSIRESELPEFYCHTYSIAQVKTGGSPTSGDWHEGGLLYAFSNFYTPSEIEGIAMAMADAGYPPERFTDPCDY